MNSYFFFNFIITRYVSYTYKEVIELIKMLNYFEFTVINSICIISDILRNLKMLLSKISNY